MTLISANIINVVGIPRITKIICYGRKHEYFHSCKNNASRSSVSQQVKCVSACKIASFFIKKPIVLKMLRFHQCKISDGLLIGHNFGTQ